MVTIVAYLVVHTPLNIDMNFQHQHLQTVPTLWIYISCTVPLKKTTYLQIKIDNHKLQDTQNQ